MARNPSSSFSCIGILIFFFFFSMAVAHHISHEALKADDEADQGRSLIGSDQSTKVCPVDFSKVDYSPLLKKCTGPPYPDKQCCDALKEVSCPYWTKLNDANYDCAYQMFSQIQKQGKYPVGLFFTICAKFEDKDRDLPCDK